MSDTFQKEYPALSDTLLVQIYSFRREAYIQKKEDSLALQMADQAIALAFDTISKVRTACYRISLLSKNGYKEQAEEEYRHLFVFLTGGRGLLLAPARGGDVPDVLAGE